MPHQVLSLPSDLRESGMFAPLEDMYKLYRHVDTIEGVEARLAATEAHAATEDTAEYQVVKPHLSPTPAADEILVSPFPFGINLNPQMFMRSEMMANGVPTPMSNVTFGNRVSKDSGTPLSREERARVAKGDFTPVTDRQLRAIDQMQDVNAMNIFGYSQGATIGLAMAIALMKQAQKIGVAEVKTALIIEAANSEDRSLLKLNGAVGAGGLKGIRNEINASHLPTLSHFGNSEPTFKSRAKQFKGIGAYLAGAAHQPNIAIGRGLARNTVNDQIEAYLASSTADLHYVRMGKSAVLGAESFEETVARFGDRSNFNSILVEEHGHDAGDNILLMTMLARMAFTKPVDTANRVHAV